MMNLRLAHQAAADRQHLLLAAGQRSGLLPPALGQARKHVEDARQVDRRVRARERSQRAAERKILIDRERWKDLPALRDLSDAQLAGRVGIEAGDVGLPSNRMLPRAGRIMPAMARTSEVLPAPFDPTTAVRLLRATVKLTPFKARAWP